MSARRIPATLFRVDIPAARSKAPLICIRQDPRHRFARQYSSSVAQKTSTHNRQRLPHPFHHQKSFVTTIQKREFKSSATDSRPQFVYKIAASYSGKGRSFNPKLQNYRLDSATGEQWLAGEEINAEQARTIHMPSGQDAFVASVVDSTSAAAFGVADGVGGWADQGIDSADFAHGICNYMGELAYFFPKDFENSSNELLQPLELLEKGYQRVCGDANILGGGSTACIAVAQTDGTMTVANLGDSGFLQLRLNAVHHYSNPQTHAFNTPFQLSRIPPKVLAQIAAFGGGAPLGDLPKDSAVTHHELRHGDILVFGTDGVWDNLSSQDVLEEVGVLMTDVGGWEHSNTEGVHISKALPWLVDVEEDQEKHVPLQTLLSVAITNKAKAASENPRRDGPFAKAVQREYPHERFSGGKVDDIAVVVAIAIDEGVI